MNPKYVTELSLSKALFEAGITKDFDSEFVWVVSHLTGKHYHTELCETAKLSDPLDSKWEELAGIKAYPALLLSELLELMPEYEEGEHQHPLRVGKDYAGYENEEYSCGHNEVGETAMEALSSLATHLLREGKFNNNAK